MFTYEILKNDLEKFLTITSFGMSLNLIFEIAWNENWKTKSLYVLSWMFKATDLYVQRYFFMCLI